MKTNFKVGDVVECTTTGNVRGLTFKKSYTVTEEGKSGGLPIVWIINDLGERDWFGDSHFKLKEISMGDVSVGDVVECIDVGYSFITKGREYEVLEMEVTASGRRLVGIRDNDGDQQSYTVDSFKIVKKGNQMKQSIQNREFIVGSYSAAGLSFSNAPKTHTTEAKAKAEAERLAKEFPGKTFLWVQFKGGAVTQTVETF